jgi:putative acetyltransferase
VITLVRTTSDNEDFGKLVAELDAYLRILDGEDHAFYAQFNKTSLLKNAVICYDGTLAVGIGAYKEFEPNVAEIKRMYTSPKHRGKGIAKAILNELEAWAKEEGYTSSILETGFMQVDAIGLYKKLGYEITENFGQYIGVGNSICMKKKLNKNVH